MCWVPRPSLEYRGEVWVASGDYKLEPDSTCDAFEPVVCDTFITESTFGLPIYRWQSQSIIFNEINNWWRRNAEDGRVSILFCYAYGKAQRILNGIDSTIGPIICHGAIETLNRDYRESGVSLPLTLNVNDISGKAGLRGARRHRAVDRGFVLSDHAGWPDLMQAIKATGAPRVIATHGHVDIMVRWLQENGLHAEAFNTEYGTEEDDNAAVNESIAFKESHA